MDYSAPIYIGAEMFDGIISLILWVFKMVVCGLYNLFNTLFKFRSGTQPSTTHHFIPKSIPIRHIVIHCCHRCCFHLTYLNCAQASFVIFIKTYGIRYFNIFFSNFSKTALQDFSTLHCCIGTVASRAITTPILSMSKLENH